ncbi:FtsW/RodA/SpoVE family cell cycle protein [Paenibacillus hodogayensis]|uniref:FtsW/RodA/SpoVE family cell cycle protein n=1 Tax=Paenibacillus hodogayensis TaxID=279208 RepID=A0ABV5W4K3_9BACL
MIRDHELVRRYLNAVCAQIRAREVHREIRSELEHHLEELIQERERVGESRDDAVRFAIGQMGDPVSVGKGLHQIHRPKTNWVLLIGVFVFAAIGIMAMYAVQEGLQNTRLGSAISLLKYSVTVMGGLLLVIALYFFDHRKLRNFSWVIYAATMGVMLIESWKSPVNGSLSYISLGPVNVDGVWIGTFLLVIAAAGILSDRERKPYFWPIVTFALLLAPSLLIAGSARLPCLLLYVVALYAMTGSLTRSWAKTTLHIALPVVLVATFSLVGYGPNALSFRLERFGAFWDPSRDPFGSGYVYNQIRLAWESAGWQGNGFAKPLPTLPHIHADYIFVYLGYNFGWLAAIGLGAAFAGYACWLIRSALRVRDRYGKILMVGIASLLGLQTGYSLLMSLGAVPLMSIPVPFISYGSSHFIAEMIAVGLALSVYRRKSMISGSALSA